MHRSVGGVSAIVLLCAVFVTCGDQAPNQRPTAEIANPGQDTVVALGTAVSFQGSATDADGVIASHAWELGDGGGATVEDPGTHTYSAEGAYTVTYQVTDNGGATSLPDTVRVAVHAGPTATIANPGQDTTITLGTGMDFQGTANDPDGTVTSHAWDFGDGATAAVEDPGAHVYAARGTYTVTYQVTDDDGVISLPDTVTVTVNQPPTALIDSPGKDTTARWPYALEFRGTADDVDGTIAAHRWDFGDGNVADVEDPGPYSYVDEGTYTVTYAVTDEDGAVSATAQLVVTVVKSGIAPEPGRWFGWPAFGLDFLVDPQGTAITEITFIFEDWVCGSDTLRQRVTASDPGWPIVGADFTIATAFPALDLAMTLQGTMRSDTVATGTWTAVVSGTTCSGGWQVETQPPSLAVFVPPDFARTNGIIGFNWLPGRQVTLEIDNGADGTVDFLATSRAGYDGTPRFHEGGGPPPYVAGEGDTVKMRDAIWAVGYVVRYATLDTVSIDADVVSGAAREGTEVRVQIDSPLPGIAGPTIVVVADAAGRWRADFAGIYDIVAGTTLSVNAACHNIIGGRACGGWTAIQWPP